MYSLVRAVWRIMRREGSGRRRGTAHNSRQRYGRRSGSRSRRIGVAPEPSMSVSHHVCHIPMNHVTFELERSDRTCRNTNVPRLQHKGALGFFRGTSKDEAGSVWPGASLPADRPGVLAGGLRVSQWGPDRGAGADESRACSRGGRRSTREGPGPFQSLRQPWLEAVGSRRLGSPARGTAWRHALVVEGPAAAR